MKMPTLDMTAVDNDGTELVIKIVPSADVDPNVWHAFRFAAAQAVADLIEEYGLVADKIAKGDASGRMRVWRIPWLADPLDVDEGGE